MNLLDVNEDLIENVSLQETSTYHSDKDSEKLLVGASEGRDEVESLGGSCK